MGDVGWHFGFEGATANEGYDRVQVLGANAKRRFQGLEVFVVLTQRVLEFEGALREVLRPLCLLAVEDPDAHALLFQHKDVVDREEHVVYLRGAVGRTQSDLMQLAVDILVELSMDKEEHEKLANMPFGPRRFEQAK